MTKIFFTGSTGCAGRNLIPLLIKDHFEITAIVRDKKYLVQNRCNSQLKYVYGDLLDKVSLEKLTFGHDIIIHAAGMNLRSPHKEMYHFNVKSTQNLLECAVKNNIRRFLYFSTSAVLGGYRDKIKMDEQSRVQIDNLYKKSRYDSELSVKQYGLEHDLNYVIIRPAMIYGPYDRANILRLINFLKRGFFVKIGNGNNLVSLVSVKNLSKAVLLILKNEALTNKEIFLISDDRQYTINEIASCISKNLNRGIKTIYIPPVIAILTGRICDGFARLGIYLPFNQAIVRFFLCNAILDNSKIKNIGYTQEEDFTQGIKEEMSWLEDVGKSI